MQQTLHRTFTFLSFHLTTRSFNLLLSTLPPLILRIVSALGFPSNRAVGIEQLKQCVAGRGVRYGIASLALLVYVASVCMGTLCRVASVASSCPLPSQEPASRTSSPSSLLFSPCAEQFRSRYSSSI